MEVSSSAGCGLDEYGWVPWRHLQCATLHIIALAGSIFQKGGDEAEEDSRAFVRSYFGIRLPAPIARRIRDLYRIAPDYELVSALLPIEAGELRDLTENELERSLEMSKSAWEIAEFLKARRGAVGRHLVHYTELVLSAEIIASLGENARSIRALFEKLPEDEILGRRRLPPDVKMLLGVLSARSRSLYRRAIAYWNRTRFSDDPTRDGALPRYRMLDAPLFRLRASADFFEKLND